ncbi:MAG: hypothetical protein J5981_00725 [Lachnospira sp.]|nr:hypothetical protein [Lachnospira sp.]
MSENILTILMWLVFILLFCIRYVLPLAVAAVGIYFVKKEKRYGYILLIAGVLIEVISIVMALL